MVLNSIKPNWPLFRRCALPRPMAEACQTVKPCDGRELVEIKLSIPGPPSLGVPK
jgi:hypothetical protein